MNRPPLKEKVEAVLEVTAVCKLGEVKTSLIHASRINESWRYIRNKQILCGKTDRNPEQMSEDMVNASFCKGYLDYQVHYLWEQEKSPYKEGIVKYKK